MKKLFAVVAVIFALGIMHTADADMAVTPKDTNAARSMSVQCVEFAALGVYKKLCAYPGAEEVLKLKSFESGFWHVATYKADEMPVTSWIEVTAFPEVSRVHVRLSDGKFYYAGGAASTLKDAWDNLTTTLASREGKQ
ncbi:hypothetical protein A3C91_00030 [Candidatus Azambacteria bacterium RIFCSPHIGHO2_02_FULL_52_12]|uniref:Uncharacterized protein n=1 Tax=Candidatus Azambacteria bacterium RIFCSPLOWO2_01_FULL_46_25 TaxID=1797298 RepID=A0A1F5BUS8_9BACT|nr:MAG: hypothetical protein A3C91_00030 [Candidatus Azambacteria bacterium RIFCSPHIGHO2_02_FULL_52_12]OGD34342.1 MAG: hypothetical protein A2988_02330 [Candidatus Azambacteria bacterium RIFCSPLOWO2_01_FULL_46_25]OGD37380.1 MAG: hypothetical protein A2850_01555 [Candidatus Azambacteria bacterium RIFCSPHIGHO2_01_FULL_51_74]